MVVVLTFIVLGGGAYAASQLPRNSVGTRQLRNGAVTRNKISKATRESLRGTTGPQGPQGGSSVAPGGTIPTGTTLRGAAVASVVTGGSGETSAGNGVSFGGFRLPSRPLANVVPPGGPPTAACPGSSASPEARSGDLCVYVSSAVPAGGQVLVLDPGDASSRGLNFNLGSSIATPIGDGTVSPIGFQLSYGVEPSHNDAQLVGTWAATG
jgi:hypothetical protein